MNVRFCPSCRSLILSDFRFCPYCGSASSPGPELAEALERPFARMAESSSCREARLSRFAELETRLARLETDMDLLLVELERTEKKG